MKQNLQKYFVWSLIAAIVLTLAFGVGIDGLLESAGLGKSYVKALPWIPIAGMVICAGLLLVAAVKSGLISKQNRLKRHIIGWCVGAILCVGLNFWGDALMKLIPRKLENGLLDYISDFANAFLGIFVNFGEAYGIFTAAIFSCVALAITSVGWLYTRNDRPGQVEKLFVGNVVAKIAAVPMVLTAMGIFVGATLWTIAHSFTKSGLLPKFDTWKLFGQAGFFSDKSETGRNIDGVFMQYERLWSDERWLKSIVNLAIYGICSLVFTLILGFLLAAMLDRKIRFENTFRTIFLYPFALSFIVTGLVWQWILNPDFGIQSLIRDLGFESFDFDPLYNPDIVIFGVLIAGLWQGTGLVMCIMLAGLRGIDEDIWKASRVDGIPMWKTYIYIVIPMMKPVFITALVLITSGIVKLYDLVVAQTSGGPGISSEVPAKYVYDKMFLGQNLGQGFAASTMMLLTVVIVLIPWAYLQFGGKKNA